MRTFTPEQLAKILAQNRAWNLDRRPDGDPRRAYLSSADLRYADLRYANLRSADLRYAIDGAVCRMDFGGWSICIRSTHTTIGCQHRTNSEWLGWSPESSEIVAMHSDATEWWRVHCDAIKAAISCVMAKAAKEPATP